MCKTLTVMLDKINNQFQIFESFTANKKKLIFMKNPSNIKTVTKGSKVETTIND